MSSYGTRARLILGQTGGLTMLSPNPSSGSNMRKISSDLPKRRSVIFPSCAVCCRFIMTVPNPPDTEGINENFSSLLIRTGSPKRSSSSSESESEVPGTMRMSCKHSWSFLMSWLSNLEPLTSLTTQLETLHHSDRPPSSPPQNVMQGQKQQRTKSVWAGALAKLLNICTWYASFVSWRISCAWGHESVRNPHISSQLKISVQHVQHMYIIYTHITQTKSTSNDIWFLNKAISKIISYRNISRNSSNISHKYVILTATRTTNTWPRCWFWNEPPVPFPWLRSPSPWSCGHHGSRKSKRQGRAHQALEPGEASYDPLSWWLPWPKSKKKWWWQWWLYWNVILKLHITARKHPRRAPTLWLPGFLICIETSQTGAKDQAKVSSFRILPHPRIRSLVQSATIFHHLSTKLSVFNLLRLSLSYSNHSTNFPNKPAECHISIVS